MTTNPVKVNSSFKDNLKENSPDHTLLSSSKHHKETENTWRMVKPDNNQSKGLTHAFLKLDTKLKCKSLITGSTPQIPTVWLVVFYLYETDLYWACYNQAGIAGHPVTSEQQKVIYCVGDIIKHISFSMDTHLYMQNSHRHTNYFRGFVGCNPVISSSCGNL